MIPPEFLTLFAAFGLAAAAGLNAWATLLLVALAARLGLLALVPPYDVMGHDAVVAGLALLVLVEGLADKLPVADHLSHLIHTVLQPAAGAILFAAQGGIVTDISPVLAFFVGALVAGTVHALRATLRPTITLTTAGHGNALVSAAEDAAAVGVTLTALALPVALPLVLVGTLVGAGALWRRLRGRP